MKRENLRKVLYYTYDPEQEQEFGNDASVAKQGYFHTWGQTPWKSPYDDSYYNRAVAVIEKEDGCIIEIPSEWLKFEN